MKVFSAVFALLFAATFSFAQQTSSQTGPPQPDLNYWTTPQRTGQVQDQNPRSGSNTTIYGVPFQPVFAFQLDAPNTYDADYYVVTNSIGTASESLPILNGGLPDYPRGVSYTLSANTTGTLTFTMLDANNQPDTRTIALTASGNGVNQTAWTCRQLLSATWTGVASSATVNITVGTNNTFGLTYPLYRPSFFAPTYSDDGLTWASTSMSTDYAVVVGVPGSSTADYYGTVRMGADNVGGAKTPDGTNDYVMDYIVSDIIGIETGAGSGVYKYDNGD